NRWIFDQFIENGVTDFDIMGLSYYWAWHQPTTIEETGDVVAALQADHPGYEVMIVETGYIWTWDSNDNANNIINAVHPDYSPPSPSAQKAWLIDLTQEIIDNGGLGVIYWEPAWVSSECWTQWGQGSHQEHATFFDFDNNLLNDGGIGWMTHQYDNITYQLDLEDQIISIEVWPDSNFRQLQIELQGVARGTALVFSLMTPNGTFVGEQRCDPCVNSSMQMQLPDLPPGIYFFLARDIRRPAPAHWHTLWIGNQ
ncbi:MAG: glycosyl hydrolase 53 family protein, partial [Saprospiraceae bacterium]|nr:glycosyl hydrolase 53 family protein [Saprospiraceae bacterium]